MDRKRYPACWDDIAGFMKRLNNWECENCGRPCRRPGESQDEFECRLEEPWLSQLYEEIHDDELGFVDVPKFGRFTLTVAHLDHDPPNIAPENLRPWCAPCHGRYDLKQSSLARKLQLKLEHEGQLNLLDCILPSG